MNLTHVLCCLFLPLMLGQAQQVIPSRYEIASVLGQPFRGDGGPATGAILDAPVGIAQDAEGNIYLAEAGGGVIRKIRAADGVIERFASGNSSEIDANLYTPTVLLMAANGKTLLFADSRNCRIRVIREDGTAGDIAGSGRCGGGGGGLGGGGSFRDRPALETDLGVIGGMAWDSQGRLIFTESDRHLLRVLDTDGYVRTLAGTGAASSTGDGAEAIYASLNTPRGLAVDSQGTIYIADSLNCKVRRITSNAIINVAAGTTTCATSTATYTGGSRIALERTGALAYDPASHALFIALPRAGRVVRYDLGAGRIAPFLGSGRIGVNETETPLSLSLNEPSGLLVAQDGALLAAAIDSFQAYRVKDGRVSTFAGRWPHAEQVIRPQGMLLLPDARILLADSGAGRILQWDPTSATISAIAGLTYPTGYDRGVAGGPALETTLREPIRMTAGPEGDIYFTEKNRIRAINAGGLVRTVLDSIDNPIGLAFDAEGRLYYSESRQHRIMRLDPGTKTPVLVAGTTADSQLNSPGDIVFDTSGNLLIADRGNHRIRSLTPSDGKLRTIAGSGLTFIYSDMTGLAAQDAGFGNIEGLAIDSQGYIYVSEQLRIDRISPDGRVEILTGLLSEADDGARTYLDGGLAGAGAIAVDAAGRLYISLLQDGRVVVATPKP